MQNPKNLRAIDQTSFYTKDRTDFKSRKHGLVASQIYSLLIALPIIAISVTFLVYNNMIMGSLVCLVVGTLLYVVAKQLERHKKALETTEFLNALFSSALGSEYKFCIIVKKDDGRIVYLNNGFQKVFPEMLPIADRTIESLLQLHNVNEISQKEVIQSIKKGVSKEIDLKIGTGKDNKKSNLSFVIEPISRPAGFCLVRGK